MNFSIIQIINTLHQLIRISLRRKKLLSDEEYKKIFTENIVLELTDDSDSEKLLGIKKRIGAKRTK